MVVSAPRSGWRVLIVALLLGIGTGDALARAPGSCGADCAGSPKHIGVLLAQAATPDAATIESYGKVLGLGNRAPQFATEIGVIRDALGRGDRAGAADGIRALYKKAGFLNPTERALNQMLSALPAPEGTIAAAPAAPSPPAGAADVPAPSSGLPLPSPVPPGPTADKPPDPYKGSVGGGPTLPLGNPANPKTDPYAGSVGGGPTLPLGQGAPSSPAKTPENQAAAPVPPLADDCPGGRPSAFAEGVDRGPTLPLGASPPPTSASGVPPAVSTAPANASCPAPTAGAIAIGDLFGRWTDDATGEVVEIGPKGDGIALNGHRAWDGSYANETLTFSRVPRLEEMGDAPPWAKSKAYRQVQWQLELHPRRECGGALVLEGNWYPGCFKWSEEIDPKSGAPPKQVISVVGRGAPIAKKYTKPPPVITDVIVLTDQTGFVTADRPKVAYPYTQRLLFIYGPGLPRSWAEPMEFKSDDPNLTYLPVALSAEKNLHPARQEQFETGWREARKNLDADTILITRDLDALLVEVRAKTAAEASRTLPGMKTLTLNGASHSWRLRFGDDRATISFMRSITEDVADPTDDLVLPERVFIEVRTAADFPIDTIPLKLQLNDSLVKWSGADTLAARRVAAAIYRTDTIELVEAGRAMPAAEKGVYFLPAHPKDSLAVKLEDSFLLGVTPATTEARVLRTPAELGETWKEVLLRAAKADGAWEKALKKAADGVDTGDWRQLSASQATEIANYELAPIILKTLDYATPLKFLRLSPKIFRYIEEVERGNLREKTPVTVGEHAALLLFRDQFVKGMTAAVAGLEQIKGEAALRGFREAVKASAWDEDSPWRYLRVSCPGGGDCSFPMVVSDSYLEQVFKTDRRAADIWVRQAVDEALQKYRQAAKDAIAKAQGVADKDVAGLIKLLGSSYQALLAPLQARMMRLDEIGTPRRQLWVPDLNGRYQLRNLHTVADAIQAQEDYSKLDTQMALLMTSAVAAPFTMGEGVVAAAVAWGTDAAALGVSLATDVPEFIAERQEIKFALGASLILGTQRLQEAELKKTEWFQLLGQLGPAAVGSVLTTVRMVGVVRTSRLLSKLERGGLAAYKQLGEADKAAFLRYATEAKLLEEIGETKAITQAHRRASATVDRLFGEMGYQKPGFADLKLKRAPPIVAAGEAGPLPKTQTLKPPSEPVGATIGVNKQGEPVQMQDGEALALDSDPAKTATLKGDKKTATLKGPEEPPGAKPGEPPAKPNAGDDTIQLGAGGDQGPGDRVAMRPPAAGGEFAVRQDGQLIAVKLRAQLGKGGYAKVFLIVDSRIPGCAKGCALKIYNPTAADEFFGVGRDQVKYVRDGAELLGDDVLQLKNLYYAPDAPQPYIIQELLGDTEDWMYFSRDKWPDTDRMIAEFRRRPELREAALELFAKMRDKGLVWEDCHIRNIFFKRIDGKWVAGILDQDRIIKWAVDRKTLGNMGAWFGAAESHFMPQELASLAEFRAKARFAKGGLGQGLLDGGLEYYREHPGPYFRDIDLFWEKSLERKTWLRSSNGEYGEGLLLPSDVEKKFPRLQDRERLGPFDPSIEFNKPQQGAALNIVPFDRRRQFAGIAAHLPLAA